MSSLTTALVYFGLVFGAGFVLGVVRTLWLVPVIGERNAELAETPVMLALVYLAARFVVGKMKAPTARSRLTVGGVALALLLACELGVVIFLRKQSPGEYVSSRDPVAGTVYLAALLLFAAAPSLVRRPVDSERSP